MRVIARAVFGLAAAVALIAPATAPANIDAGHPTNSYTRFNAACDPNAPIRAPVTVVLQGFGTEAAARQAITAETTGWSDPSLTQTEYLRLVTASGGTECLFNEATGRLSPLSGSERTLMRLWGNATVTAGTPTRQTNQADCAAWITAPNGYNVGRNSFRYAFQSPSPQNGPYPLTEVNWGNTLPIQQCDGTAPSSNGLVTTIRPKDSFGYNDNWVAFSDDPPTTRAENALELVKDQGATVARYPINWRAVGLAGSDPVTTQNCLQMGGNWGAPQPPLPERSYDRTYRNLTGRGPCDDSPPTTGIRPVLAVLGAPPPYATWCTRLDDDNCVAGDCTSGIDRTPHDNGDPNTIPAIPSNAADTDWKGFVQNVALRYPLARGIEIWNEPNLTKDYWGSCLIGPARYAQLLDKAHEGVVASGTGTPVVLAGMSPREGATDNRRWTNYLNAVFDADPAVPTLFNVMGLHPYRSTQDLPDGFGEAAADDVKMARDDVLAPNGIPLRTIWVTEVGATTANTNTGTEVPGTTFAEKEDNQATALGSIYYSLRNLVPVVLVHRLIDPPYNPELDDPPPVEDPGYGAISSTEATNPLRRKDYYYEICQRRAATGLLC
ncbi:MAG: hypothetical protein AABM42_10580 [Actinomycetota bacterium]